MLRNMSTADIAEIRFYDAAAATQRWGMGHGAGVISIATRSR
jgi:spore coat protein U-like protein